MTQEDPIAIECQQPNSLYCKTCTTDSCNSQKPLQCVQCESNDDKCTTSNQNELAAMVAMCNFGKDRCFVSQIDGKLEQFTLNFRKPANYSININKRY